MPGMDIIFVIDASGSITEDKFRNKLCKYVADAVADFKGDIKTGVVVYSSRVGTTIPIQNNSSSLVQSIRGLPYIGDRTNTAGAIETAKDLLFDKQRRTKVMAVLTDGESDSPSATSEKATAAKKAGIQIYAIGMGADASQSEIKAIASFPNSRYAHSIAGFESTKFDEDIQKLLKGLTYPCEFDAYPREKRTVFNLYGVTPETKKKNEPLCGCYDMRGDADGTHGWAYIINNYDFENPDITNLTGYQRDEEYLIETFRYLGYNVKVARNLRRIKMEEMIEEAGERYQGKKYDSFICCVLSHGEDGLVSDHKGNKVRVDTLYDYLKGDNCKELIGKPKMFFFQSCRGKKIDVAVDEKTADLPDLVIDSKVPALADFFFGYATSADTKALVTEGGSRYIIELCKTLALHAQYASLTEMMTYTNHRVGAQAIELDGGKKEGKQAPVFSSSATKEVFFF